MARINGRFGEGGDGRINDRSIQEGGESEGIDCSSVGLGLTALVLFRLSCFRALTTLALLLFPCPPLIPVAAVVTTAAATGTWDPYPYTSQH